MSRYLQLFCLALPLIFAIGGFNSRNMADFWLENLVVFAVLLGIVLANPTLQLSAWSWLLIGAFLCVHEYGALYAYSSVPLGEWAKDWLHTDRNHYDRLVHFLYGLLITWPMTEAFRGKGFPWPAATAVQFILATSAIYEIIEWIVATIAAADLAAEFVGSQGDVFDAPKDMTLALLGSLLALSIARLVLQVKRAASSN